MTTEKIEAIKKPSAALVTQIVAALTAANYSLQIVNLILQRNLISSSIFWPSIVISVIISAASIFTIVAIQKPSPTAKIIASVYLWFMLIGYPFYMYLGRIGYYVPAPEISNEELAGAAIAEGLRYAVFLALIVWVGLSKRFTIYAKQNTA